MLAVSKFNAIKELIAGFSKEEIIWLNGYLAGLVTNEATQTLVARSQRFTIAYGTETGNSRQLATSFALQAKNMGFLVRLISLEQYRLTDLSKEELFFTIISTQGEGEPPIGAKKFYDYLFAEKPPLQNLSYAVLALGDTSYPLYCKTGEDVDEQFFKLGGKRLLPLQKCDVDYEADAESWFKKLISSLQSREVVIHSPSANPDQPPKTRGRKYYEGKIISNMNLNGRGSKKETYHIEIGAGEPVEYEPGDSLAIIPQNRKSVVAEIIALTGVEPGLIVETNKHSGTVEELLTSQLNICYLLTSTVKSYAELTQQKIPETRMDLKDLLRIYPVKNSEQFIEVLSLLKPVAPRLYTISSSPTAHQNEIHLTVSKHSFLLQDEQHFGLCSEFLGELPVRTTMRFYIQKNRHFALPAPDSDLIMIGPGAGVAPFRSFVAERDATGAPGRNWLFFGDQHFTTDFLYQTEWQTWLSTGCLTKMNVAFSRDQEEKLYVQHKIKEQAKDVFVWLENGAFVYLCGAKGPMNGAVEAALEEVILEQKNCSEEEAKQYFENLKKSGRYLREVY